MFRYKLNRESRWKFDNWTRDDLADLIHHAKKALWDKEQTEIFKHRQSWTEGDRVWAKTKAGKIHYGTIFRINVRSIVVQFDDGYREKLHPFQVSWFSRPQENSNVVSFSQKSKFKKTSTRPETF